ncbi:MAG TPA: hypothetical protein VJ227_01570 [Patescibacteria group bacterium]|nr:hypothetical protein [Patescibacteria group bacterium]
MLVNLLALIPGILVFLFVFWKRLNEDYAAEVIFRSAILILLGVAIGWGISERFYKEAFLWLSFFGAMGGLGIASYRHRIKFYESFEAMIVAALPWISFLFLKDSVVSSSLSSFIAFLSLLIIVFIAFFFDQRYKDFAWYKSGKIGFTGLATLTIIFLTRLVIAILQIPVISFLGRFEAVASGVAAFISLILLINLGRQSK